MKLQIFTRISESGKMPHSEAEKLREGMKAHYGKDVVITVERKRRKRSLNQNSYYWGIVIPMVQHMLVDFGNDVDPEETHAFLKEHVGKLTGAIVDGKGKRLAIVKSSASLNSAEFEVFLERIKRWAAAWGTVIPDPNENLYQKTGDAV